jgi:hypothetical protein
MAINPHGCNCSNDITMLMRRIDDLTKIVVAQGSRLDGLENTPSWFPKTGKPVPPPSQTRMEHEEPK